jgi:hypothetical protein
MFLNLPMTWLLRYYLKTDFFTWVWAFGSSVFGSWNPPSAHHHPTSTEQKRTSTTYNNINKEAFKRDKKEKDERRSFTLNLALVSSSVLLLRHSLSYNQPRISFIHYALKYLETTSFKIYLNFLSVPYSCDITAPPVYTKTLFKNSINQSINHVSGNSLCQHVFPQLLVGRTTATTIRERTRQFTR